MGGLQLDQTISKEEEKLADGSNFFFHLLLGRKAMTDLDSAIKSRDITLTTKIRIVFPVVVYRCESWTIEKGEF